MNKLLLTHIVPYQGMQGADYNEGGLQQSVQLCPFLLLLWICSLRFLQCHCWKLRSSGLLSWVAGLLILDVSEECTTFICRGWGVLVASRKTQSLKMRTACFFEMSWIGNPATRRNNPEGLNWVAVCSLILEAECLCIIYINCRHKKVT